MLGAGGLGQADINARAGTDQTMSLPEGSRQTDICEADDLQAVATSLEEASPQCTGVAPGSRRGSSDRNSIQHPGRVSTGP